MKDKFFCKKRYQGLYEPIYRFREFGDLNNYWIRLRYICNRDDWQTIKSAKGTALDFELLNEDGEKIFGEIPTEHLNELKGRNYILGGTSEPETISEDACLVSVDEIYVYAPQKTYITYDSDIVPIFGLKDTDYSTQSSIPVWNESGGQHKLKNQFYGHTVFEVADASKFQTGDYVIAHFTCVFGEMDSLGANIIWHRDAWAESSILQIIHKDLQNNLLELSGSIVLGQSYDNYYNSDQYPTHNIYDFEDFFKVLNGDSSTGFTRGGVGNDYIYLKGNEYYMYMLPLSGFLLRAYSTRSYKKRECMTREETTFHLAFPEVPDIFIPQQETGYEYNEISRETTMTPLKWKEKIENGDWFIYSEPKVIHDTDSGIYELRVKKTPCR